MGRPDAVFRISSITVTVNFVLGVALVLTAGAIGVIVATVVAETLRCLLLHRALRRNDVAVPVLLDPLRKQFRSAGRMAVAIVVLGHAFPNAFVYRVALIGSVGVLTYLALFLAQDGLARRSIADFGLPVRALFVDGIPGGQTTR